MQYMHNIFISTGYRLRSSYFPPAIRLTTPLLMHCCTDTLLLLDIILMHKCGYTLLVTVYSVYVRRSRYLYSVHNECTE